MEIEKGEVGMGFRRGDTMSGATPSSVGLRLSGRLERVGGWNLEAPGAGGGVIFLAGGYPDTSVFEDETLRGFAAAVSTGGAGALQYGPTDGSRAMREVAARLMVAEGTPARPEHVFVTNGAQQGLDLAGRALLDEGDLALVESPTYHGALQAFSAYGPRLLTVPVGRRGMDVEVVREILTYEHWAGSRAKFVYAVPTFQNPTGATMPPGRRRELLELAREHDLLILEDNPYGLLRYEGEPPDTLAALELRERGEPEHVVYLGSVSKVFAPGVRLGWVHANPNVLGALRAAKKGADLGPSALSQALTVAYFDGGEWKEYLERLRNRYRARREAMLEALDRSMPEGVSWTEPEGGFFIWVTLPGWMNAATMLPGAVERGVAYVPGGDFRPGGWEATAGKNALRLSFSFEEPDSVREGVEILADLIRERIEEHASGSPACGCETDACACTLDFSCTEELIGAVAC